MAAGIINLQKASGGITKISSADGTGVTELVVPESGELITSKSISGFKEPAGYKNRVIFTKTAPASFTIPSGLVLVVNNKVIETSSQITLSLNSNLDTGTKVAGTDYYVYAKEDGTFYISASKIKTE